MVMGSVSLHGAVSVAVGNSVVPVKGGGALHISAVQQTV